MTDLSRTTLDLEISSLDRAPVKLEVTTVTLPGEAGLFEVLPGHAPTLSRLEIGVLSATTKDGQSRLIAIDGGLARVLENQVLVLAHMFELDTEIDAGDAEAARESAERTLKQRDTSETDVARAEVALKRALIRLQASRSSNNSSTSAKG